MRTIGKPTVTYRVGDLVKIKETTYYYLDEYDTFPGGIGVVVGKTNSWYEAYDLARKDPDDTRTHYWDSVNYAPYKVLMCGSNDLEWISEEHMEFAYEKHAKKD